MDRLTETEIAAIAERAAKATPGPWAATYSHQVWDDDFAVEHNLPNPEEGVDGYWISGPDMLTADDISYLQLVDAEFIARARNDVPALIATLAARDAEVARLREALRDVAGQAAYFCGNCEKVMRIAEAALANPTKADG